MPDFTKKPEPSYSEFLAADPPPDLQRLARDWRGLWTLAIIYFALAVLSAFLVKRRQAHG